MNCPVQTQSSPLHSERSELLERRDREGRGGWSSRHVDLSVFLVSYDQSGRRCIFPSEQSWNQPDWKLYPCKNFLTSVCFFSMEP